MKTGMMRTTGIAKSFMSKTNLAFITPNWPAPSHVKAISTTRRGGVSILPYDSLNLGDHVGDASAAVAHNRALVSMALPKQALWLKQVHGTTVVDAACAPQQIEADASIARTSEQICTIMTADCLPVLFCDRAGSVVGAAHAGWRGLLNGVLESTVDAMQVPSTEIMAWLGPAIGPTAFEVGAEVRDAFIAIDASANVAFLPSSQPSKWLANIYQLAQLRLKQIGVKEIYGGDRCTYSEKDDFFSYRRDGQTGRMASLIWLE